MSDPIEPLRAVRGPQRRSGRERRARLGDDGLPANLPAVVEGEPEPAAAAPAPAPNPGPQPASDAAAAFAAQLLGQPGQKRGLRAGPPVLDAARAAYKKTEYSGPADRRPPAGGAAKTEI
ncbi:MAG TPA: hypothetical protein VEA79_02340 [Phenylobacterium sp.]|nr:hypothetical protein [Phenylobacterium sp.]